MSAPLWQHVVVIGAAVGAAAWLVRRALGPRRVEGPCASCPASRVKPVARRATGARGESSPHREAAPSGAASTKP